MSKDIIYRNRNHVFVALCFIFLGAYTEVGLSVGGGYIPSFFTILFCGISYLLIRPPIYLRDLRLLFFFMLFVFASALLAPNYNDINSRFVGVLQISIAFAVFVATFKVLTHIGPDFMARFLLWMLRLLVILTITEYFGLTTEISDSVRSIIYASSNYGLYQADARDLSFGTSIRPKVFTTEPSLVAIGFFILVVGVVASSKSLMLLIEVAIYIFLQYYFLNSPIVLLSLVAFVWVLSNRYGMIVYGLSFILLMPFLYVLGDVAFERMERLSIANIIDAFVSYDLKHVSSEMLRLVFPYIAVLDVFNVNPFTGLGISGKRSLELYSTITPDYVIAFGNNAFATIFIYFGLIGVVCLFSIMYFYLRAYVVSFTILLGVVFLFMQTMGGFETVRFWVYLAFLVSFFATKGSDSRHTRFHN